MSETVRSCFDCHSHRPASLPVCSICFGTLASLRSLGGLAGRRSWLAGRALDALWPDELSARERAATRGLRYVMQIGDDRLELSV